MKSTSLSDAVGTHCGLAGTGSLSVVESHAELFTHALAGRITVIR
jgi:hypothetical protein